MLAPSTIHPNFSMAERNGETIFVHKTKHVWVVNYDAVEAADYVRPEHWSVYYAIEKRKKGRDPWAHNNKRLGDFATLEAALLAGDGYIGDGEKA